MADPAPPADPPESPKRVKRYVIPRKASRLSVLSAVAAGALLLVGVGAYVAGWAEAASPGPIAAAHAGLSANCAECHQSRVGVVDLRCERCHDPLDSRQFSSAAHVLTGTDDQWKAAHAETVSCSVCHLEHRGRTAVVAAVKDEACATCHTFGAFGHHPEFALIRSQAPSSNGLEFSHAGHLRTLAATGQDRCERCHQPTPDQKGFQPISFDRFCASCHLKNGVLTINGTDPAETSPFAAELLQPLGQPHATVEAPDGRGRQKLIDLPHADPWLLERVARLTVALDPSGAVAADRRARVAQAIRATEAVAHGAVAGLSAADLTQWAEALKVDVDSIDRQLASPSGALSADAKAKLADLAAALASVDPSIQTSVSQVTPPATPAATATADDLRREFEARRAELTALLDAVRQRGDAAAQKVATDLQQRLAALSPGSSATAASPADQAALLDRLQSIGHAIDVVRAQAGASAGADLDRALDLARQQIPPGASEDAIASRQAELTQLLDAIDRSADPAMKRRVAELRAALDELAAGSAGDAALANRRAEKARLLDRIALELELPADAPGPTPAVVREQSAAIRNHATALQTELSTLSQPASGLPPLAVSAADARKGVTALLYACVTCHRLNADGTALLPVRADLHQLTAATFSHKEHLAQTKCETCHAGVETSAAGDDALMPKVATCQSCHNPSQAPAKCAECHRYHAQPLTAIGLSAMARR
jgi:c(7)-type cytochrome triheme protein